MQFRSIKIEPRTDLGSGVSRVLRKQGLIPCVVYGDEQKTPYHGVISNKDLLIELRTNKFRSQVYELDMGDRKQLVVIKELQTEPVYDRPIHVDFQTVSEAKKVRVMVPLNFINREKSAVLRLGGTLSIMNDHIPLLCPLKEVPEQIDVDLSAYQTKSSIQAAHITLPANVERASRKASFIGSVIPAKKKALAAAATAKGKK